MYMKVNKTDFLEDIMGEALSKNGIPFTSQVSLYEKGKNFHHKYVLDFLVEVDGYKINIETDGGTHKKKEAQRYDLERDIWVKNNYHADMVLRFSAADIVHRIDVCINEIKQVLMVKTSQRYELVEIVPEPKRRIAFHNGYITNISSNKQMLDVDIYTSSSSGYGCGYGGIYFEMEAKEIKHKKQFEVSYKNVDSHICQALSILQPLKKLSDIYSYQLTFYIEHKWIIYSGNRELLVENTQTYSTADLWLKVMRMLDNHNYRFKLLEEPEATRLRKKAKDIRHRKSAERIIYNCKQVFLEEYLKKHLKG